MCRHSIQFIVSFVVTSMACSSHAYRISSYSSVFIRLFLFIATTNNHYQWQVDRMCGDQQKKQILKLRILLSRLVIMRSNTYWPKGIYHTTGKITTWGKNRSKICWVCFIKVQKSSLLRRWQASWTWSSILPDKGLYLPPYINCKIA